MSLDVHLDGRRIGLLERATGTDYVFAYAPDLLAEAGEGAVVLSHSLPVRTEAFGSIETRAFFDGDGASCSRLRRERCRALPRRGLARPDHRRGG